MKLPVIPGPQGGTGHDAVCIEYHVTSENRGVPARSEAELPRPGQGDRSRFSIVKDGIANHRSGVFNELSEHQHGASLLSRGAMKRW
jgi:hypothetical protein